MRPYRESRLRPKGLAEIGMASTEQSSETPVRRDHRGEEHLVSSEVPMA